MEQEEALRIWVNSLPSSISEISALAELYDGIKLGEAVAVMLPEYLNPQLIKKDFGDNGLIRAQNLKRIVSVVQSFLKRSNIGFDLENRIDIQSIAQNADTTQLAMLIEGILAVGLKVDPARYVAPIEYFDEPYSFSLMKSIEKILSLEAAEAENASTSLNDSNEELDAANVLIGELKITMKRLEEEKEKMSREMLEYASAVGKSKESKKGWKKEREEMLSTIRKLEQADEKWQKQTTTLQQEVSVLSQSLGHKEGDYKALILELQEQATQREEIINRQKRKVAELEVENQVVHDLRERVEALLEKEVQAEADKRKLERLREKLQEWKKTKDQLTSLELVHDDTLKENSELGLRVQQQSQTIKTLSNYKAQYSEASSNLLQLEVDSSVKDNHIKELEEQVLTYRSKHNDLRQSNQSLEHKTKELSIMLKDQGESKMQKSDSDEFLDLTGQEMEFLTPEWKEKMRKLEIENETLKKNLNDNVASAVPASEIESLQSAQAMLEQTVQRLKEDLTSSKTENINLRSQINLEPTDIKREDFTEIRELQRQLLEQEELRKSEAVEAKQKAEQQQERIEIHCQQLQKELEEKEYTLQALLAKQTENITVGDVSHSASIVDHGDIKEQLEMLEIENRELEKALDSLTEEHDRKKENLQIQVDLLHSSLAALGLRYSSKLSINAANSMERLSLLGMKRKEHGIL